ncbi:MAG: NUDIX domain-containing protein [Patescibacteria group bacterium]
MEQNTKVGVGVMILKENKILLGKRKNAHGEGEYAFPGGHLEYMESFSDCALREIREECGIEISDLNFLFLLNLKKYAPKHYVHIGLIAKWKSGIPKVLEPNKCEGWDWYSLDALPEPLFEACKYSIESYKTGRKYFDFN